MLLLAADTDRSPLTLGSPAAKPTSQATPPTATKLGATRSSAPARQPFAPRKSSGLRHLVATPRAARGSRGLHAMPRPVRGPQPPPEPCSRKSSFARDTAGLSVEEKIEAFSGLQVVGQSLLAGKIAALFDLSRADAARLWLHPLQRREALQLCQRTATLPGKGHATHATTQADAGFFIALSRATPSASVVEQMVDSLAADTDPDKAQQPVRFGTACLQHVDQTTRAFTTVKTWEEKEGPYGRADALRLNFTAGMQKEATALKTACDALGLIPRFATLRPRNPNTGERANRNPIHFFADGPVARKIFTQQDEKDAKNAVDRLHVDQDRRLSAQRPMLGVGQRCFGKDLPIRPSAGPKQRSWSLPWEQA